MTWELVLADPSVYGDGSPAPSYPAPPPHRDQMLITRCYLAVAAEPFSTSRDIADTLRAPHPTVAHALLDLVRTGKLLRSPAGAKRTGKRGRAPAWVYRVRA